MHYPASFVMEMKNGDQLLAFEARKRIRVQRRGGGLPKDVTYASLRCSCVCVRSGGLIYALG